MHPAPVPNAPTLSCSGSGVKMGVSSFRGPPKMGGFPLRFALKPQKTGGSPCNCRTAQFRRQVFLLSSLQNQHKTHSNRHKEATVSPAPGPWNPPRVRPILVLPSMAASRCVRPEASGMPNSGGWHPRQLGLENPTS